jgi:hypothetical protein
METRPLSLNSSCMSFENSSFREFELASSTLSFHTTIENDEDFSEDDFAESGPSKLAEGTLNLLDDDDDFSEGFEVLDDVEFVEVDDEVKQEEEFSDSDDEEILELSEEMKKELCSSESSDEAATSPWVRTNSGRDGELIQTAEDEHEKIGVIKYEDGTQCIRSQKSYRHSDPKPKKFVMDRFGNLVVADEIDRDVQKSKVQFEPLKNQSGHKIARQVTRHSKAVKQSNNVTFSSLKDTNYAPIPRQVTRHTKALNKGEDFPVRQVQFTSLKSADFKPIPRQVTRHTKGLKGGFRVGRINRH